MTSEVLSISEMLKGLGFDAEECRVALERIDQKARAASGCDDAVAVLALVTAFEGRYDLPVYMRGEGVDLLRCNEVWRGLLCNRLIVPGPAPDPRD